MLNSAYYYLISILLPMINIYFVKETNTVDYVVWVYAVIILANFSHFLFYLKTVLDNKISNFLKLKLDKEKLTSKRIFYIAAFPIAFIFLLCPKYSQIFIPYYILLFLFYFQLTVLPVFNTEEQDPRSL